MWTHTGDGPDSGSSSERYVMACGNTSLPIQDNIGGRVPGSGEANIEECLCSEICSGDIDRVRSTCSNTRPVKSQASDDLIGYQHGRNVELRAGEIGSSTTGHQDPAVPEQ